MKILLVEPFFGGSHRQWAEGLQQHSQHQIELLTLSAHHWKWRMHGAAVTLVNQFLALNFQPDLVLVSDMLDLATFLGLTRQNLGNTPIAVYFHENQLTYPWSPTDQAPKRGYDSHYKFINYTTALSADWCLFNSNYNMQSFLGALPSFLSMFPDHNNLRTVDNIKSKSQVLHLGLDLSSFDQHKPLVNTKSEAPILLWNHRWEYDKGPEEFFEALFELKAQQIDFRLVVLGESTNKYPKIFDTAQEHLKSEILHWGYCASQAEYVQWLWKADILPVTSHQDFFGGSIIEAIYCNTTPLLPKRLAYPEHFPQNLEFFYEEDCFLATLAQLIQTKQVSDLSSLVSQYDWSVLIQQYDTAFQNLL
ncbi:MAG: DUF3524 domain-containing protein [Aureispira sp.]|nr:DUF3524 domain-containing protein [Aureispira sp.]